MDLQTIINDISIVIEAIDNQDTFEARAMLVDIQQDLKVMNMLNEN